MYSGIDRLVSAYRDKVEPRMRDLPVYNAALEVEAVDFEPYEGRLCGVLVTPWCVNLVLLPGEDDDWSWLAPGTRIRVAFPAGEYPCLLSAPEGMLPHLSLPLFTTVQDFADQDTARRVAREVLRQLYQDTRHPAPVDPVDNELDKSGLQQPLSRRRLLHGWLASKEGGA